MIQKGQEKCFVFAVCQCRYLKLFDEYLGMIRVKAQRFTGMVIFFVYSLYTTVYYIHKSPLPRGFRVIDGI